MRKMTLDDVLERIAADCRWCQWTATEHPRDVRVAIVVHHILRGLSRMASEQRAALLHSLDLPIGGNDALLWNGRS